MSQLSRRCRGRCHCQISTNVAGQCIPGLDTNRSSFANGGVASSKEDTASIITGTTSPSGTAGHINSATVTAVALLRTAAADPGEDIESPAGGALGTRGPGDDRNGGSVVFGAPTGSHVGRTSSSGLGGPGL